MFSNNEYYNYDPDGVPGPPLAYQPTRELTRPQNAPAYEAFPERQLTDDFSHFHVAPAEMSHSRSTRQSHQPHQPQLSTLTQSTMTYALPMSPSPSSPRISPEYDQMTTKWRNPILPSDANMSHPLDDASRVSEEAKRLRNTAASARFRAKKKQRELELERMAQEKADRATELESKVTQLEMENSFLKALLTEKNDRKKDRGGGARNGKKVERNAGERSTRGHTDGVGTDEEQSNDDTT